jgi:hypothetical protein
MPPIDGEGEAAHAGAHTKMPARKNFYWDFSANGLPLFPRQLAKSPLGRHIYSARFECVA